MEQNPPTDQTKKFATLEQRNKLCILGSAMGYNYDVSNDDLVAYIQNHNNNSSWSPTDAKKLLLKTKCSSEDLCKSSNWLKFVDLVNNSIIIPEDLLNELQSSLLRSLLCVDSYPRIRNSEYTDGRFANRSPLYNQVTIYTYRDVYAIWSAFLRGYNLLRTDSEIASTGGVRLNGLAEFITTGKMNTRVIDAITWVEEECWKIYITSRIAETIKQLADSRVEEESAILPG